MEENWDIILFRKILLDHSRNFYEIMLTSFYAFSIKHGRKISNGQWNNTASMKQQNIRSCWACNGQNIPMPLPKSETQTIIIIITVNRGRISTLFRFANRGQHGKCSRAVIRRNTDFINEIELKFNLSVFQQDITQGFCILPSTIESAVGPEVVRRYKGIACIRPLLLSPRQCNDTWTFRWI